MTLFSFALYVYRQLSNLMIKTNDIDFSMLKYRLYPFFLARSLKLSPRRHSLALTTSTSQLRIICPCPPPPLLNPNVYLPTAVDLLTHSLNQNHTPPSSLYRLRPPPLPSSPTQLHLPQKSYNPSTPYTQNPRKSLTALALLIAGHTIILSLLLYQDLNRTLSQFSPLPSSSFLISNK